MRGFRWIAALGCLLASTWVAGETWHVATEEGYRPYNYTDPHTGLPAGLDVELVTAVLDDLHVSYDFTFLPWGRVKRALVEGKVDLAFQFLDTPQRRAEFLLVGPFRQGKTVFACLKGCAIDYHELSDLRPYRLTTVAGYAYGNRFDQAGLNVNNPVTRSELLPGLLLARRTDLIVGDELTLHTLAARQGVLDQIEFLPMPLSLEPRYVAFRHGNTAMAERFEHSLAKLRGNGTLDAIVQRWTARTVHTP